MTILSIECAIAIERRNGTLVQAIGQLTGRAIAVSKLRRSIRRQLEMIIWIFFALAAALSVSTMADAQEPQSRVSQTPMAINLFDAMALQDDSNSPMDEDSNSLVDPVDFPQPELPVASTHLPSVDIPPIPRHGPMGGNLDRFRDRANQMGEMDDTRMDDFLIDETHVRHDDPPYPVQFDAWWQDSISAPLGLSPSAIPIDVAGLTQTALISSPYVQGILTEPKIRQNDLVIADAEFDSMAFVEAKFADTNEPVGSTLTTGNSSSRFRDETLSSAAGLRRKNRDGSSLEIIQRGGFQENNSIFLSPNSQGTTRLEINYTQPLLKDQGRAVNNTRVLLAKIDLQLTNTDVRAKLEDHLLDVTRAYWELYTARAEWMQRNRLLDSASKLHQILEARGEIDSHQRQILRAKGAVASRRSDLIRAETRIRNSQARLRLLTGDPKLIQMARWELTPQDQPLAMPVNVSMREATLTALDNRADIASSIRKIQAVSAKVGAARNQVLPRLDMILSTYVAGLDADSDTFGAFINQFSDGRPSYAAGLLFEVPIGNRASRARLARNRWEFTRTLHEFQQTTEATFADVEIAVRETRTAYDEMFAKQLAIEAAGREVEYLQQRWELLPDPNESAILLIENLLDAQQRLADEERSFTRSQVDYAMSWVRLRKSMGVLLRFDEPNRLAVSNEGDSQQ